METTVRINNQQIDALENSAKARERHVESLQEKIRRAAKEHAEEMERTAEQHMEAVEQVGEQSVAKEADKRAALELDAKRDMVEAASKLAEVNAREAEAAAARMVELAAVRAAHEKAVEEILRTKSEEQVGILYSMLKRHTLRTMH
jgi:hypothetical protein